LEWNIAKADHIIEGENIPTASRIRRGNKLSTSTITPAEFKDADGNVLGAFSWVTPDDEMTETGDFVKQVKFTPTDTTNYNEKTFDVTVNVYRPSSGGGGSSSNITTTTTKNEDGSTTKVTENKTTGTKKEVTTNADGSTTTVETKKDGTVTTTEKDKDGNTVTTVEKSDGTSTTTEKNADGSEKVTEEKADGTTVTTEKDTDGTKTVTTENADGSRATEEVRKDGTEVKTETTANGETTAEIKADGKAEVTIPVSDTEKVQMVVVTDENGDSNYITDFETREGGIAVTTEGDAKVHVLSGDKKEFADVHHVGHWSEKSVDFVYLLGLMNGTGEHHFSPDEHLTRAMLVAVLYRAEGEPAVENDNSFEDVESGSYYEKAVAWAKANGIVNGTSDTTFEPDTEITREQIAAIMHRYAQYKGIDVSVGEDTNILSYEDFDSISEYAIASMQWAVGAGLMQGKSESTLNSFDNATRAETAAILERFIAGSK
ncbi:MAG: S-layer homology domain-containing protein, partial [Clostridia bacterium]|nr:S-layer homology domain-containing protein [Clostridia bacterium]